MKDKEEFRMKSKVSKILLWAMIAITAAWVIFLFTYFSTDGILEFCAWGLLAIITAPAMIAVLVLLGIIRSSINGKNKEHDPIMYRFSMGMTVAFAILTLTAVAVRFLLDGDMVHYPWSYLALSSAMEKMGLAFGAITLISLLVGVVCQFIMKRLSQDTQARKRGTVRTIGICLTVAICLAILLVLQPMGSYNDGGSKQYESVLYQVIDWNRTQEFDGTPFYEENQNMRIYFFPFNCYEYEAKWEMQH